VCHRSVQAPAAGLVLTSVTTDTPPPSPNLYLVVGYDGSGPASRALDAAVSLLRGRAGRIDVVYVAHMPGIDMMSADAVAEEQITFDDIERDLRTAAAEQLSGREERWQFERRQGLIADQLLAAAKDIHESHPGDVVSIVVGSSSQALHRMLGSAAVSLARHSPVPVVIVP
jgi:nucleotide-binding universal stress UspA family protein